MTGTINSVNVDRGFGFIRVTGRPQGLFFHVKDTDTGMAWDESLKGQRVEFDLVSRDDKERAVNVRPA